MNMSAYNGYVLSLVLCVIVGVIFNRLTKQPISILVYAGIGQAASLWVATFFPPWLLWISVGMLTSSIFASLHISKKMDLLRFVAPNSVIVEEEKKIEDCPLDVQEEYYKHR